MRRALLLLGIVLVGCQGRAPAVTPERSSNATLESPEELAAAADVTLYPGATFPEGKSNIRTVGQEARYEVVMTSADPVSMVENFYRSKMGVTKIPDTNSMMGFTPKGNFLKIDVARDGVETTITAVSVKEARRP